MCRPILGAFAGGGPDHGFGFRVDEFLERALGENPDALGRVGEFAFFKELEQSRLGGSHRVLCPYCE